MSESAEKRAPPACGTPCWIEIPASDVQSLKKFYSIVFPSWDWHPSKEDYPDDKYALFQFHGMGLSGGIVRMPPGCKKGEDVSGTGTTVYHFVQSIDDTKKVVEESGGKVMSEKVKEGENGWYMYFLDVQGNRFGIYEVAAGAKS